MKKILNISYDLRDRYNRKVTPAIRNLINASKSNFDAFIIDLVRTPNPLKEKVNLNDFHHIMIDVFGLPYGLLMNWSQDRALNLIKKTADQEEIDLGSFSLVHSHKLTFEGMIGYKLSKEYNTPLIVTLRQTDTMVFNNKPGAIKIHKPVIEKCTKILYLIPQILLRMEKIFGKSFFEEHIIPKAVLLPNIVDRKINVMRKDVESGYFVTVLKMEKRIVYRKNIKRLLLAFNQLRNYNIKLSIVGDGSYRREIEKWVNKLKLDAKVKFIGHVDNDKIDEYYSKAEAFLLPSISESFGLVYAEALLNGTPIMYSKDHLGFDGFFDGVGVGVNPKSVESIKDGILKLFNNGSSYRKNINGLNKAGEFDIFSSSNVSRKYTEVLESVST
jgi:glycosyltransferase involved in cell wall biosynthesis